MYDIAVDEASVGRAAGGDGGARPVGLVVGLHEFSGDSAALRNKRVLEALLAGHATVARRLKKDGSTVRDANADWAAGLVVAWPGVRWMVTVRAELQLQRVSARARARGMAGVLLLRVVDGQRLPRPRVCRCCRA